MDYIFCEAPVGRHAGGAMSFVPVCIVQTGRILANQTVIASAAAVVGLDTYPIADDELVNGLANGHHGAGPLVPRGELAIRRGQREVPVVDLKVRSASTAHGNLNQHLAKPRFGHRLVYNPNVLRTEKNCRPHALRYNVLLLFSGADLCSHRLLLVLGKYLPT